MASTRITSKTTGRAGVLALLGLAAMMLPVKASAQHAMPAGQPMPTAGAAAPVVSGAAMRGIEGSPLYFGAVLFDQAEYRSNGRGSGIFAWQGLGYYGTDVNRVWVNSRGETARGSGGGLERLETQVLYSRLLGYYWDIQAGIRHDLRIQPRAGTPPRTYGVVGVQGLAPGFFQMGIHAFVGERGIPLARASASYDLLITNRLVLQPEIELNLSGGWDREALIAPGLYRVEVGLRLRYEITREFAPYIGFSHETFTGGAAGLSRR